MIRPMTQEDLDQIEALEQASFKEAWSRGAFENELSQNPYSHQIVLEEEGKIIGYAIYWIMFEQAQLASIAVDPAFRRKHYGQLLLDTAIDQAQKKGVELFSLEVRVGNTPAKTMYEKRGFVGLHTSKHYYSDGEDALVMGLGL